MPALRKLHRIAFLAPSVTIDGPDAAYAREAALLLWVACIETCHRHPGLAVYDPESTPLFPQDGHFVPQHATPGADPGDAFWASTRRDELVWLELSLPRSPVVRLHALARDGRREAFEAAGRNVGEQIHQALGSWLGARGLPPPPRRFEAASADEILAAVRAIGPSLVEQAVKWSAHAAPRPPVPDDAGGEDGEASGAAPAGAAPAAAAAPATAAAAPATAAPPRRPRSTTRQGSAFANRLPAALRVPALRALELALREDLGEAILAADPDHPRALFAQFLAKAGQGRDFALLRRIIAQAPGWARPYGELVRDPRAASPIAPSLLETVAGAGIAALCRPGQLDVVIGATELLRADGRPDEALRLMARGMPLHDGDPRAHVELLRCHRAAGRVGGWIAQAHRSARAHGCPADPYLPWYPDQIQIDLLLADALLAAGRWSEAIALRAGRLEGREAAWPRHARTLERWRDDPRLLARCYAREGAFRGDPGRVVEGFGRAEPADDVELAMLLDALVAIGREEEVPLAWAEHGYGRGLAGPSSRLAAARGLLAAGDWRRGIEELWRAELGAPERDEQVAIARIGLLASSMPLEVAEAALAERLAIGAVTLARRMARDVADFVPHAAKSSIVLRALGHGPRTQAIEVDPVWLAPFPVEPRARRAIDALFAAGAGGDPIARADRLVERWLETVYAHAAEDDPAAFAQVVAYVAAQALTRYLAGTTAPPSPLTAGLRLVAAEALALVRRHRAALADRAVRAFCAALEPLLRRVDRWLGTAWLATVERSCGIDERAGGDVAGFVRESATVAARILGPEEVAVLSASIARLHRERPDGWESAAGAQAGRLALHTGFAGVEEWADATAAQLTARTADADDAVDALLTACYLAEGKSAIPCVHAARVLFDAGRTPAALSVLTGGLSAASPELRARLVAALAGIWRRTQPGVPLSFDEAAAGAAEALARGDATRAAKLARWAIALGPTSAAAHRTLGLALARQGKLPSAVHHLVRAARDDVRDGSRDEARDDVRDDVRDGALELLAVTLAEAGRHAEAAAVLAYASRWFVRPRQWLAFATAARAAGDPARAVRAYGVAHRVDPAALEPGHLDGYAGALDEAGDPRGCERIAQQLRRAAGDDPRWQARALHHAARAAIALGRFDEAAPLAEQALKLTPEPDRAAAFAATLEQARSRARLERALPGLASAQAWGFAQLEAGDLAGAAARIGDASWRVRRAALAAARFRLPSENDLEVTSRALAAALATLADGSGVGRPAAPGGAADRDALLCRLLALEIREQACSSRDPAPRLGERLSRDAFHRELRARGGAVLAEEPPPPPAFADRAVVPGGKVARASDYVALLRDLAALAPREALAQFDLDEAGYLEVARAWAAAMEADPAVAALISAGLAKR